MRSSVGKLALSLIPLFESRLVTCVFYLKSSVIVTPRYLIVPTFLRTITSKVNSALIVLVIFLVNCIIMHMLGWNLIPYFLAKAPSPSISFCYL